MAGSGAAIQASERELRLTMGLAAGRSSSGLVSVEEWEQKPDWSRFRKNERRRCRDNKAR